MIPIFEEIEKAARIECATLEDERGILLLDLIASGMSEKDAGIAVDLHMQITMAPLKTHLQPIHSIGSDTPVDWIPALSED
jgi:hypothetical protein